MQKILAMINRISTCQFEEDYKLLNNHSNRNKAEYLKILQEWALHSEIKILANEEKIKASISNDKKLQRIFNNEIIKTDGYNWNRLELLKILSKQ